MYFSILSHKPYRMVFVSLIATLLYLSLLIFLRFYRKKPLNVVLTLLGFSILPIISIFRQGSYESGDLTINMAKLMSFYSALSEGQLIPHWAGELNATYGYPNFIFAYPLPYYLGSLYHFFGLSFLNSLKLVLITSYISSGLAMYFWLKNHVSERFAFVGAIFYLFAPYHLIDMHFRVDIGEMLAMVFMPLSLYLIDKANKRKSFLWKFLTGLSISFLILSHQAVSLLGIPLLFLYSTLLLKIRTLNAILKNILPFLLGLAFSAYYWLPVLMEAKFTHQLTDVNSQVVFPKITSLLYSPWRLGFLFQGPMGELSPIVGYAHWIIIFIAAYLILIKRYRNKYTLFFFGAFWIYLFLIISLSKPIWDILEILRRIQFPYRILSIIILVSSAVTAFAFQHLKNKKLFYFLLVLAIGSTVLNWGNRGNVPEITDKKIAEELPLWTAKGEGLGPAAPIWIPTENLWQKTIPKNHLETMTGEIRILSEERSNILHSYKVEAKKLSYLKENTYYFPGWELTVDGATKEIIYTNKDFPGIITFELEKGVHKIILKFKYTSIRYHSFVFSVLALILSASYLIIKSLPTPSSASSKTTTRRPSAGKA